MDVKTLMWGSHLLLVLSDGHDLPPSFGTDSLSAKSQLKCIFAFLCSCAIFNRRHFDVFKGMCTHHLMSTETENTDLILRPTGGDPFAKLLSWSVKTRVVSGLILWCLFCRSALRKPVSCMISDVVILILAWRPLMLYQPRNPTDWFFCQPRDSYLWNMDVFGAAAGYST